jgi:alkanesulfonate monooxygenase SsuD/methylene tetrahydromethanopterin reductase-like flavin-dependent oxidoreductase (luciferase family)
MARVRQEATAAGRDPQRLAAALMVPVHCRPDASVARLEARESLSRRFRQEIPVQVVEQMCVVGTAGECAGRLIEYTEAGVQEVVLSPLAWSRDPVRDAQQVFVDLVAPMRSIAG